MHLGLRKTRESRADDLASNIEMRIGTTMRNKRAKRHFIAYALSMIKTTRRLEPGQTGRSFRQNPEADSLDCRTLN